ncbi:MAG: serine/threonine protein kinase [Polyangiaceae bacterium]|nr:serine/threonine protein kinase [Polyangiaceae bacterium]
MNDARDACNADRDPITSILAPLMEELIGGRYRTEEKLGAGGMGTVYAATDTVTGARVAVKVVAAQVAENEVLLSRFEREVRAVRALETPHVVRMFDAGRDAFSELPFFVMEVLDGDDVAHVVKRLRPLRPDLVLRIGAQACSGLEVAHAARIVHRDIKPSNLFLAKGPSPGERTVKILDFGIAKLVPEQGSSAGAGELTSLTETGSMLGSPLYMAPEQARGHKNIDARADIWSLGVVLYQGLTGRTPHPYTDALGELIIAICTEPAERVEKFAPWVPKAVADVVHRALEINPAARFQTMAEMRAALVSLLPGGSSIHESMIVTMPESERVALPEAATNAASGGSDGTGMGGRTISDLPTAHWAGASSGAMQLGPVTTAGARGSTTVVAKRAHTGILVASVVAFAALGGVAAFLLFGGAATPKEPDKPAVAAQSAAVVVPTRVVRVGIEPAGAEVSVDGRAAALQDGAITIEGTLGSSHVVRVSADGRTETKEVIIAEQGASPDRVVVGPATTAASATAPVGPVKKGTLAPRTTATSKPQPPPPGEIYLGR